MPWYGKPRCLLGLFVRLAFALASDDTVDALPIAHDVDGISHLPLLLTLGGYVVSGQLLAGCSGRIAGRVRLARRARMKPKDCTKSSAAVTDNALKHGRAMGLLGRSPCKSLPISACRPYACVRSGEL